MTIALPTPVAAHVATAMTGASPYYEPDQHGRQQASPAAASGPTPTYGPLYYHSNYYSAGYIPQQQPFPNGVRGFHQPAFPQHIWYGPPAYVNPSAVHMRPGGGIGGGMDQQPPMYSFPQARPMVRPLVPGMLPPGAVPLPPQHHVPPVLQQERPPRPRSKFLIPGNGVRSNSTSSVRRGSVSSVHSVRSLSEDMTEQQQQQQQQQQQPAATATPLPPPPASAPPTRQQKDDSNAHAPCAFFMRTGTCAYGSRCKFQHASPTTSMAMLNSLGLPLRPGQPECQFYTKHMRCGFGASCKYHHPEPQGHQWAMVTQAPYMYPQPGMVPYVPPMAPAPLVRSNSSYSEASASLTSVSARSLSSVPSIEEQSANPQAGTTGRRCRLSYGGRGSRSGDISHLLPRSAPQPSPSPPAVQPLPVLLPSGDDIIVHEAVQQPALFGELPAFGEAAEPATSGAAAQGDAAAAQQTSEPAAAAADVSPTPGAVAAPQAASPKQLHQAVAASGAEGDATAETAAVASETADTAAHPAARDTSTAASQRAPSLPPEDPATPLTTEEQGGRGPQPAAVPLVPAQAEAKLRAAASQAAAVADAAVATAAEALDRMEVESSDGSFCSAASQSGSQHG